MSGPPVPEAFASLYTWSTVYIPMSDGSLLISDLYHIILPNGIANHTELGSIGHFIPYHASGVFIGISCRLSAALAWIGMHIFQ